MAPIAIIFGVLLTALGLGLYVATDMRSLTALIPSFLGGVLIVLGLIARSAGERARMHAMHVAALVGLLGLIVPAFRVVQALARGDEINLPIAGQMAMALLSGIFLALCVKSFIDVRRARRLRDSQGNPE